MAPSSTGTGNTSEGALEGTPRSAGAGQSEVDASVALPTIGGIVTEAAIRTDVTERVTRRVPLDPAPVAVSFFPPPTDRIRSQKQTLSSPIPALLAASMREVDEPGPVDASVPQSVSNGGGETSRLDPSQRHELLQQDDDDEYVVEVDPVAG